MKILVIGDLHERVTSPENRIDNFQETLKNKVNEIINLARTNKVSAILHTGDFWDSPNPPLDFATEVVKQWTNIDLADVFKKIANNENIDEIINCFNNHIPIIGVVGNHELFGNNIATLNKTIAGFLGQMGIMHYVTKDNPYFIQDNNIKVAITGTNYHLDIDTEEHIDDYIVNEKLGDYHIHIVHGMLSNRNLGKMIKHTTIDQIKDTKADITISGHDHIGFPTVEYNGKYFVNPGAVVRLSNNLKEINRHPKVLIIDISQQNGIKIEEHYLKTAKKGDLVLSRKKIEEKQSKEEKIEEFKKSIRLLGQRKSYDIVDIIREISQEKNIDKNIIEEIINDISKKKIEIGEIDNALFDNVVIEKIVLENFQSHKNTVIECSDKFNVFVGESGQGKSAILRALAFVFDNSGKARRYIKRGEDYAKVTLILNNGYIISRYVEAKKNGKNGYEIYDPNKKTTEFFNTKILTEVQRLLGYAKIKVDKDIELSINFMKQGDGWFLISNNYTSPQRAKIIGGIYGTHYADAVLREYEKEERYKNEKYKETDKEIVKLDEEINKFSYLPDLEMRLHAIKEKLSDIEKLKNKKEKIIETKTQIDEIKRKLSNIGKTIEKTRLLEQAKNQFLNFNELINKRNRLHELNEKIVSIKEELYKLSNVISKTNKLDVTNTLLDSIKENLNNKDKILKVKQEIENLNNNLISITKVVQKTENINKASEYLQTIVALNNTMQKLKEMYMLKNQLVNNIDENKKIIKEETEKINCNLNSYKELLKKIGKCPICLSIIDEIAINRVIENFRGGNLDA